MTPEQHILDALKTMEDRGVEPTMQDWEAIAELISETEEENEIITNRISTGATCGR